MLIKHVAYQVFIDLLTTHGKTSSSAFLQLYTPLSDVPDPFPLLEASVEALVSSEDTLPKVIAESEELKKRVGRLSSQLEETEKKLQDESIARRNADAGSSEQAKETESRWTKVLEEKQSNWEAKERTLEEKVENQDRLLKELKASYEVSQRLGQNGEANEGVFGKAAQAELDMLNAEFDRTSARLAEMEAHNEQLRMELAGATSQHAAYDSAEHDAHISRLQTENSSLLRKVETIRFDKESESREWANKTRQAERQRQQLTAEVEDLKSRVQKWSDYNEMKRELDMLRSIELSTGDEEDEELPANVSTEAAKGQSLEQLLLTRNKKLSSEMTLLRVSHQDTKQQHEDLQEELSRTNAELEKSQMLATKLEDDLLRLQEGAPNALPSSGMSIAGTYTSRYHGSARRGRASPTSSIISGYETQPRSGSTTLEALRSGEPVGGGSGILPMIQAQRDRFKQKNQQLEEELQKTYATVTSLRQEVASLQKDNLALYEKTRYVSTYSRGSNMTSSSAYGATPSHTSVYSAEDAGNATDRRWKSQYEANISPFAAFRGREATRAYKRMSLPERMIFSLTRIVLATRTSRNLFAVYCVALHLMVFCTMYWVGTTQAEQHPGHIADTMAAVAAGGAGLRSSDNDWQQEGFG